MAGAELNKVRKIVKGGLASAPVLRADESDIVSSAVDAYGLWDGDDASYYAWVGAFPEWWPQQKQDARELAAAETGEIYGVWGVEPPSSYGAESGPFAWEP